MDRFTIQTQDQKTVLGVAFSFSIVAVVAVGLRLVVRSIAHKRWFLSDYLITTACVRYSTFETLDPANRFQIFAVGLQSISITSVFIAGIGYGHVPDIILLRGVELMAKLSKLIVPLQILCVLSLSCTKISILCLYSQLFPIRWVVWSSYATITIIVSWTVATILAGCLICRSFAFNWDKCIIGGSCGDQVVSFTVTGIINLTTDVIVLLLPMQPLYRLQMATYKKVTLVSVFGVAIL
jgi:hypothetical protein